MVHSLCSGKKPGINAVSNKNPGKTLVPKPAKIYPKKPGIKSGRIEPGINSGFFLRSFPKKTTLQALQTKKPGINSGCFVLVLGGVGDLPKAIPPTIFADFWTRVGIETFEVASSSVHSNIHGCDFFVSVAGCGWALNLPTAFRQSD